MRNPLAQNSDIHSALGVLLMASFVLTGCVSPTIEVRELTVAEERRMTRELQAAIRSDFPALRDAEIQAYVSRIGAELVAANDLEGKPYHYSFTVVDSPLVNAFALPAGAIYITNSLLKRIESEAELAGILGHEIAHVVGQDASKRVLAESIASEESWIYGVGGGVAGGIAGLGAASLFPGGASSAYTPVLTAASSMLGAQSALFVQKYRHLANNRSNELEADRRGFIFATRAGFSSEHVGDFYARISFADANSDRLLPLSSHPTFGERLEAIERHKRPIVGDRILSAEFTQLKARF